MTAGTASLIARRGPGCPQEKSSKHEIWTHLEGYLASREPKPLALAGGDVRFGGVEDLVGVGIEYDGDRLLTRFAIVLSTKIRAW